MWIFLILLIGLPVWAQSKEARMAQRASIEKQRAAVLRHMAPSHVEARVVPMMARDVQDARPGCSMVEAPELGRMIEFAAEANQVPPKVVREVARQESAFRPCAVSSKGAEGLMQLMPATQTALGVDNPFDPEESLMAGARLLRELLSRYNGSLPLALSAYNAGPKQVDRAEGIPRIAETRNYVAQILSRLTD